MSSEVRSFKRDLEITCQSIVNVLIFLNHRDLRWFFVVMSPLGLLKTYIDEQESIFGSGLCCFITSFELPGD